jgi:hypothetical protein
LGLFYKKEDKIIEFEELLVRRSDIKNELKMSKTGEK